MRKWAKAREAKLNLESLGGRYIKQNKTKQNRKETGERSLPFRERSKSLEPAWTDPTVWLWIRSPSFYHLTENHLPATAALAWILGGQRDSVFPGEQTLVALLGWGCGGRNVSPLLCA